MLTNSIQSQNRQPHESIIISSSVSARISIFYIVSVGSMSCRVTLWLWELVQQLCIVETETTVSQNEISIELTTHSARQSVRDSQNPTSFHYSTVNWYTIHYYWRVVLHRSVSKIDELHLRVSEYILWSVYTVYRIWLSMPLSISYTLSYRMDCIHTFRTQNVVIYDVHGLGMLCRRISYYFAIHLFHRISIQPYTPRISMIAEWN